MAEHPYASLPRVMQTQSRQKMISSFHDRDIFLPDHPVAATEAPTAQKNPCNGCTNCPGAKSRPLEQLKQSNNPVAGVNKYRL
jgi:hypothetical protein